MALNAVATVHSMHEVVDDFDGPVRLIELSRAEQPRLEVGRWKTLPAVFRHLDLNRL